MKFYIIMKIEKKKLGVLIKNVLRKRLFSA